jgi:hypothetical protein
MGYRTERKHKQEQRAHADWQCQKDREQDAYFYDEPPLTDAELAAEFARFSEDKRLGEVELMGGH